MNPEAARHSIQGSRHNLQTTYFSEEQHFRQRWLWALLFGVLVPVSCWFVFGVLRQLITGEPFGRNLTIDLVLGLLGFVALLMMVAIIWFFCVFKLQTQVTTDAIRVGFFSQRLLRIGYSRIRACTACTYHPVRDFGGWGNRRSRRGRALTVHGNRGVQLELTDGCRLLIGSQRADELASVIEERRCRAIGSSGTV